MNHADSQFDALADAYEDSIEQMPFRKHIEMHSFLQVLGDTGGLRVLDLGCGSGLYTRAIAQRGARRVVGLDVSEGMIDYARQREDRNPLGIGYRWRDATRAPDTVVDDLGERFDLVTAIYVLPYAPTLDGLTSICRTAYHALSAPGDRFVAAVLNPEFSRDRGWYRHYGMELSAPPDLYEGAPVHLHAWFGGHVLDLDAFYWSRAAHERAFADAGFAGLRWHAPVLADSGRDLQPSEFWRNYLHCPHAMIVEARR
ncbi:class I SAM-dependent methyltransferase [Lysobacter sp. BMK333-48F3]|uniref:class I SAM-dependent methyltransferase n=1 Tax=Lysobacter sp. BMK333-48F3 TaxID=2867962 RepID=UPI001C8BD370|nr:class I SAM-dependent methyltransferase [Lysobacter sp. BMK333-48F3]MBX9400303.1 class I SAM-dependent methyltransferase [Lysobacter sp. BMK333-48F3]